MSGQVAQGLGNGGCLLAHRPRVRVSKYFLVDVVSGDLQLPILFYEASIRGNIITLYKALCNTLLIKNLVLYIQ